MRSIHAHRRRPHGFTLIELAIVVLLIVILGGMVFSAAQTMQRAQRARSSADKVLSMLHLARSLAIANNAVYHVRIHNFDATLGDPKLGLGEVKTITGEQRFADQYVAVYQFPDINDALKVNTAMTSGPDTGHPVAPFDAPDPLAFRWSSLPKPVAHLNNYLVARADLEMGCYVGILEPADATTHDTRVLSFLPDGTASIALNIFVTDSPAFRVDYTQSMPEQLKLTNIWRRERFESRPYSDPATLGLPARVPPDRASLEVISVFQGGMLRLVKQSSKAVSK